MDEARQGRRQAHPAPAPADPERAAEGVARLHPEDDARKDVQLREVTERLGVDIGDPLDSEALADGHVSEALAPLLPVGLADPWDGVTVRIGGGLTEELADPRLEPFADPSLEPVGLRVELVERKADHPVEEGLEQPMSPDDAERLGFPGERETDSTIGRALGDARVREPCQHRRHGGSRHPQLGGKGASACSLPVPGHRPDDPEVELLCLCHLAPSDRGIYPRR